MEKKIRIEELLPGDVFLFSYVEDDLESKLIALLSKSDVSHAAMVYEEKDQIIEETPDYAKIAEMQERIIGRTITVMRLKDIKDGIKVTDIAKKYVDEKTPYAMMSLPFVGVYLLLKDMTCGMKLQQFICKIAKLGLEALIGMVYREDIGGTLPMVCSQYVYHCYKEAGEDYEIKLNSNENSILSRVKKVLQSKKWVENTNLEQLIKAYFAIDNGCNQDKSSEKSYIDYKWYKELEGVMGEAEKNIEEKEADTDEFTDEFILSTYVICKSLCDAISNRCNLSKNQSSPWKVLEIIEELGEYFVTPGDLKNNTSNLEYLGILEQ